MHHFLEDPSALNDFAHDSKVEAFQLARLEDIQPDSSLGDSPENVDTEEEIQWGKDMQNYRREFLKKWRGEEGIGFVDDLGTGFIAPLMEDCKHRWFPICSICYSYMIGHAAPLSRSSIDEETEDHGTELCSNSNRRRGWTAQPVTTSQGFYPWILNSSISTYGSGKV